MTGRALIRRTTGSGTTTLDNVYVEAAAVVPYSAAFNAKPTTVGPGRVELIPPQWISALRAPRSPMHGASVRERSRPWIDSGVERASDDPLTHRIVRQARVATHAADALVERAGRRVDPRGSGVE